MNAHGRLFHCHGSPCHAISHGLGLTTDATHSVPVRQWEKKKKKARSGKWTDQKEPVPLVSFPPIFVALVKETRLLGSISERCGGEAIPEP